MERFDAFKHGKEQDSEFSKRGENKAVRTKYYTSEKAPTSGDVYKIMAVDENNQLCHNMMHMFRVSLLIPPSTANVERGYSVINLFSSLGSSLNQASFDRLM